MTRMTKREALQRVQGAAGRLEVTCGICGGNNHIEHACPSRSDKNRDAATSTPSHDELLAIHHAVMNPMDVQPNEDDTYTLKRVKEFILRAVTPSHVAERTRPDEHTAMLLAAISVAAISNTRESAAKNLLPITHPCHTAAYGDVVRAAEREMELREKLESLTPSSNAPVEQSETRIRHALADLLGFAAEVMEDDDSEDCAIVRNPDGDHDLCGLPLCKATGCAYLKMKNAADALEAVPARRTITPSATEERDDQCRQAYHRDASQAEIGLTTPRPTSPDWTQYAPLKAGKALDVRDLAYAWAKGCNDQAEEIFKVRGGTATVPPSAKASFSRIDLGLFVNAAGISGADVPHIVVEKLQKALDAANVLAVAESGRKA